MSIDNRIIKISIITLLNKMIEDIFMGINIEYTRLMLVNKYKMSEIGFNNNIMPIIRYMFE